MGGAARTGIFLPANTVAMSSIEEFSIRTNGGDAEKRLEALYRTGSADVVHGSGREMFEALKVLRAANPQQYRPAAGVEYPRTTFGQRLAQIAETRHGDEMVKRRHQIEARLDTFGELDMFVHGAGK